MFAAFTKNWRGLVHDKPGHRFQNKYERKKSNPDAILERIVNLVLALVCFGTGVILMFIPGPAILFFFIGGGLLAAESRKVATLLDHLELKLRALWNWIKSHWRKLPLIGKIAIGSLGLCGAAAGTYAAYLFSRIFWGE